MASRTTEEQPRPTKPSHAQALNCNTNTFEKVNPTNHQSKPNKNVNERLRGLSPANQRPKQGIIWSRNNSKTDLSSNCKYQQGIKQGKEIQLLKQAKNNQETKRNKNIQHTCMFKKRVPGLELINVINFIEQTMTTLSSYGKCLKTQLDFSLTQQEKQLN